MKKILALLVFISFGIQAQNLNKGGTKSKNYYSEIDFEWVLNTIIVPAKINGKTYRFILDTGAPNVISKRIYNLIKPKIIDSISISDINNIKKKMPLVSIKNIIFGGISFENIPTLVYDYDNATIYKCFQIDGVIGSNMLRNSIIQFNLETKKITLTDNRKMLSLKRRNSTKIEFIDRQSTPFIYVKLKGKSIFKKGKQQIVIDTGANSLYSLSRNHFKVLEKANILKSMEKSYGASNVGLFGTPKPNTQNLVVLPLLKINRLKIKNYVTQTDINENSRIGSGIFKYGITTLDYKNKRFYLKPKHKEVEFKKNNSNSTRFGFSIGIKKDKFIVGFIWKESLKKKLYYGDEILEINGKKVNVCDYILSKDTLSKDTLTMKIKSTKGQIFEIVVHKK